MADETPHDEEVRIYMDYAASTPVDKSVLDAMHPYWRERFANPMSHHKEGRDAKEAVEEARAGVAEVLHARPREVVFTSSGTEANSLAISGFLQWLEVHNGDLSDFHFVTSAVEHSSVLHTFERLRERGAAVDFVGVTDEGVIDLDALKQALRPETVFVSVMYVNNEIGTIQPVEEIARILEKHRDKHADTRKELFAGANDDFIRHLDTFPVFHTDATQAPLFLDMTTDTIGADLMTLDGQKIYGPKGVGVLFKDRGTPLFPLFLGGGQEHGLRAGTENTPLVIGMAKALVNVQKNIDDFSAEMQELQTYFLKQLDENMPEARLNGSRTKRVPHNINITLPYADHEFLAVQLDERGIAVATKSACLEGGVEGSHVLQTLPERDSTSALRFTFGKGITKDDIDHVIEQLTEVADTS